MTIVVIAASSLLAGNAFSADWKFFGEFALTPDESEIMFYDADSIIKTNNSIKLWAKTVLYSDIEKSLKNELLSEKATKKIAAGYNPPITKINPNVTNVAYFEEAANESSIKSKTEILYQVICADNTLRKISGSSFNKNGRPDGRFGISKWERIIPESNAGNLAKIICGSK
jgi:hypothetical protein